MLAYGIPDLTGCAPGNVREAARIARLIEEALRCFEPRLDPKSIKVERLSPDEQDRGEKDAVFKLRYRINGLLRVEPEPEPISFDTEIDQRSGKTAVANIQLD